jgi:hypothetical protein
MEVSFCNNTQYQTDPNLEAARKLGITNDQYQVDQSLIAAQKLGLANVVAIPQSYHQLPGTNQFPTYTDPAVGYVVDTGNEHEQPGGGFTPSSHEFHQPSSGSQGLQTHNIRNDVRRAQERERKRAFESDLGSTTISPSYPCTPSKSTIKPDLSFNFKLFDKFEDGMMFLCNRATERECLKSMIFAASASMMENMVNITEKTALFLYRLIPNRCVLHGVFEAVGVAGLNIIPDAFGGRFPAQIRVKPLFRFPHPVPNERLKKVFNNDNRCRKLNKEETRLLLREFSILYLRDTLVNYLTRQMGLNEFVPICATAFDFTKKEMEEIQKSCFEE